MTNSNVSQAKSDTQVTIDVDWTSEMPERRKTDRRSGVERRIINKAMIVPDVRSREDRRLPVERRRVSITITGRAQDA